MTGTTSGAAIPGPINRPATAEKLLQLMAIMEQLRGPEGCPWDREQTPRSLLPYLLEETYEVMEAVDAGAAGALREELGDLLLHIVFQAHLAESSGDFDLADCLEGINLKLIRRHPHVFGDQRADGAFHAKQHWEAVKQREKGRLSRLEGVPKALPALSRARRLQEKAAYAGFDWQDIQPVWDKVHEEIKELQAAQLAGNDDAIEEELGDVLFSVVNLGRFYGLSSEGALRRSIAKFEYRFGQVESELRRRGKELEESTLEEMDAIWNRHKKEARQGSS